MRGAVIQEHPAKAAAVRRDCLLATWLVLATCALGCSGSRAPEPRAGNGASPALAPAAPGPTSSASPASPASPAASPASAAPAQSCREWLERRERDPSVPGPGQVLICQSEDDAATRELVTRLASKGSPPELSLPVINTGCRLERLCGNIAGVDCKSAVDGPYDYFEMTGWTAIAHCGGRCMGGRCTNCPPQGFGCPTY